MSLTLDLMLTFLHHLSVLALIGCLAGEWALLRLPANERWVEWLPRVDLAYGMLAALVLAAGVGRVAWGLKGMGFYLARMHRHGLGMHTFTSFATVHLKYVDFWRPIVFTGKPPSGPSRGP